MKPGQITIINEKEARGVLDMPTVLADVETVLKEHAQGESLNPIKLHLPFRPQIEGYMNSMPAYLKKYNLMGAKLVTCHRNNPKKYGYPNTMGTVVLEYPETGLPFAVVDGTSVTNIRTGAAAGVGAKWLAKKGAKVALSVGAGAQGYTSAEAILTACPQIEELRVADPSEENRNKFIAGIAAQFPRVKLVPFADFKEAVPGAEIIAFATNATEPLSRQIAAFDKGTVVLLVAEFIDNDDLLRFDRRVADFPACFAERINQELVDRYEEFGTPYSEILTETFQTTIGDVIAGNVPARENDDEIVAVAMCGMGIEDLKVAKTAYDRVTAQGGGVTVDFINV